MQLPRILNPAKWLAKGAIAKTWLNFSSGVSDWRNNPQWFQMGDGPPNSNDAMQVSTVYACVKLLSEEMARLNVDHLKQGKNGGTEKDMNTSAFRVMRNPNRYQSRSDFILYMMMQLLLTGNAYAIATRDKRGAINSLHPLPGRSCTPNVVRETGEVFYHFTSFDLSESEIGGGTMVPQSEVLHIRLFTPTHPLMGQSPLLAGILAMNTQQSIKSNANEFFANMSKPAGLLTTPKPLPSGAAERLKKVWNEAKNGGTPILDNEITYQAFTMSAVEADLVAQFNLSVKEIASIFRIPLIFLGEDVTMKFNSVDDLQRWFTRSTLGFYLEHFENALDKFFEIPSSENLRFDLESGMMRSDLKSRMEALKIGVTGGILKPDEARAKENLAPVKGGDQVFMQQQNWPLELLGTDPAGNNGAAPEPAANDDTDEPDDDDDEKAIDMMNEYLLQRTLEVTAR